MGNKDSSTAEPRLPLAGGFRRPFVFAPTAVCLGLVIATLALYAPVATHGYVNYDDADYASANPHVQAGLAWESVKWAFTTGHASNWHPLTWLSHMLDWQLFGDRPGAFHLVSVGFHAVNALLLFLGLRRWTGALWRSAFVAALFALHPVHVESVAWISERKDVLSAFFFFLTLLAYANYVSRVEAAQVETPKAEALTAKNAKSAEERTEEGHASRITHHASRFKAPPWYLSALVFFALGLMSKPMLVTTPFVLWLMDYWPLQRFGFGDDVAGAGDDAARLTKPPSVGRPEPRLGRRLALLILEKLPFFVLAITSSFITFLVQRRGGAVSTALTLGERVSNALVSYGRYLGKTFWPEHLSVLYPHPGHWPAWRVALSAAVLLAISASVVAWVRRRPYLFVGWFWFLGMLVPVIGLVQVGIQSMADRYTYVPLIGVFVMLAWGIGDWVPPRPWRVPVLGAAAGAALIICAGLTARQTQFWKDSEALFSHAVQVTDKNYLAYNNLGYYLSGKGKVDAAMECYRQSLAIKPDYEDALNNLGYALAGRKQYTEAIDYYERALRVKPNHPEVNDNLGNALSELGRIDEAIAHYQITLRENPEHADAHNNYGIALAMKGKLDDAVVHFHAALRFKPNYASAHSNLGNALAVQKNFPEAIKEFEEALRLNPDDAQAHNNLGNVLAEQGRLDEAVQQYHRALLLNTNNPEGQFNLALALIRQGNRPEAISHLTEALRLQPDYPAAKQQLNALRLGP